MKNQEIITFGRRRGKKLSTKQEFLLDNLLPELSPHNLDKNQTINHKDYILEIGFGGGEHLAHLARLNPDAIIIGAEPFVNGVSSLLSFITDIDTNIPKPEYKNIRIWADDARQLLNKDSKDFLDVQFSTVYILHPDPWPKARHEKRRLLNSQFLNLLSQRLSDNAEIIIGTDHWEYYDWIKDQLINTDLEIKTTNLETIETKYQKKNMAQTTKPKYLVLGKK